MIAWLFLFLLSASPVLSIRTLDPRTGKALTTGFAPLKVRIEVHSPDRGTICIITGLHGRSCFPVHSVISSRELIFRESDEIDVLWVFGEQEALASARVEVIE